MEGSWNIIEVRWGHRLSCLGYPQKHFNEMRIWERFYSRIIATFGEVADGDGYTDRKWARIGTGPWATKACSGGLCTMNWYAKASKLPLTCTCFIPPEWVRLLRRSANHLGYAGERGFRTSGELPEDGARQKNKRDSWKHESVGCHTEATMTSELLGGHCILDWYPPISIRFLLGRKSVLLKHTAMHYLRRYS